MTKRIVSFIYGFTEGEWQGHRFRKALAVADYSITKDVRSADIIIAHSGGCYYVPLDLRDDQLVILINPTYWPGKPLARRAAAMSLQIVKAIRCGNEPLFQLHKTFRNLGYLFWHSGKNYEIIRRAKKFELPVEAKHRNTIIIRNLHDPWLTPDLKNLKRLNPHLQILELSGEHDDCWVHPERYINLLQSESERLT
jgi:hypothetical protein